VSCCPRLASLRAELAAEGLDRVVLCGMGGSSLAPEVVCATAGRPLVVLDTTDPGQVRAALEDGLDRTVLAYPARAAARSRPTRSTACSWPRSSPVGCPRATPRRRFVVVTDPGSPLAEACDGRWRPRDLLRRPQRGRPLAARCRAFGLVPSALAGVDVAPLLDDAEAVLADLAADSGNPGLDLGRGDRRRLGRRSRQGW
jgi:glucose-6-phosphate isomerase